MPDDIETCSICDTPEACRAGETPCNLCGKYIGGDRAGEDADVQFGDVQFADAAEAVVPDLLAAPYIRWPTPDPRLFHDDPGLYGICAGVFRLLSKTDPGDAIDEAAADRFLLRNKVIQEKIEDVLVQIHAVVDELAPEKGSQSWMFGLAAVAGAVFGRLGAETWGAFWGEGTPLNMRELAKASEALAEFGHRIAIDQYEQLGGVLASQPKTSDARPFGQEAAAAAAALAHSSSRPPTKEDA